MSDYFESVMNPRPPCEGCAAFDDLVAALRHDLDRSVEGHLATKCELDKERHKHATLVAAIQHLCATRVSEAWKP